MNRNRKANTKKSIRKRVLAGSMAVMLGAGLAGTCGYYNSFPVQAQEKEAEELQKAAENVINDNHLADSQKENGKFYKDESVYVKADASGNVKKTTVTEWLKNLEKGEFADCSELDGIKNVKGDEAFTKGSGNDLNWQSEGNDIYYQGTTKKKLPVDVNISYKLNGKEISPEDLKGKDGKVEMKIDYKNHSRQKVSVGGKQVEMYTPFTMVTALMLSTDGYKNVTIDNGKVLSDADKNIVLGVAMPGMKENLGVKNLDIDIPESVTITADVKNATINPTVTVASTEILDQFDLNNVKDFDDLESSMKELENAAEQLVDGSGELADGVNTLNDKSGELITGVNDLEAGVNQYTGGVFSLAEGSAGVAQGAKKLDAGAAQMQGGIAVAKAGADELAAGIQTANGVVEKISTGLTSVAGALDGAEQAVKGITATSSLNNQESIINSAADAAAAAAVQAAGDVSQEVKDKISTDTQAAVRSRLSAELGNSGNWTTTITGKDATIGYIAGAQGGISEIQSGIVDERGALKVGMDALSKGVGKLQAGLGEGTQDTPGLTSAAGALKSGTSELSKGADAVANGAAELNKSSSLLNIGMKQLKDGGDQLVDGVCQLADGANTLSDGMSKFKEDGIDKLTSVFDGDIKNVTDRLDAMTGLGKAYKSFAGIKDGVSGSTKFIIETDGID